MTKAHYSLHNRAVTLRLGKRWDYGVDEVNYYVLEIATNAGTPLLLFARDIEGPEARGMDLLRVDHGPSFSAIDL